MPRCLLGSLFAASLLFACAGTPSRGGDDTGARDIAEDRGVLADLADDVAAGEDVGVLSDLVPDLPGPTRDVPVARADTTGADFDDGTPGAPSFEDLFSPDTLQTIRIDISPEEWDALLHDFDSNDRSEVYRRARFLFGPERETAVVLPDVGFRVRGNGFSRERPEEGEPGTPHDPTHPLRRAHFKIKLDETFDADESVYGAPSPDIAEVPENRGRAFTPGVRTLNLKYNRDDPSLLREVLSYELFRRFGVETPRAAFARVLLRIGDEPEQRMGVFTLVEDVDARWLRRRYSESGFLFKCLYQHEGPADLVRPDRDGDTTRGRIGMEVTDPAPGEWPAFEPFRPSYDLKTRSDEVAAATDALNALIDLLGASPSAAALDAALDVEALLRAQAMNAFLGMSDDYWRNGNNYYLTLRPTDGRWLFVPYDYDRSFGTHTIGPPEATSSFLRWGDGGNTQAAPLVDAVLAVPAYAARYRALLATLAASDGPFTRAAIEARMAELRVVLGDAPVALDALDEFPYDAREDFGTFLDLRIAQARRDSETDLSPRRK